MMEILPVLANNGFGSNSRSHFFMPVIPQLCSIHHQTKLFDSQVKRFMNVIVTCTSLRIEENITLFSIANCKVKFLFYSITGKGELSKAHAIEEDYRMVKSRFETDKDYEYQNSVAREPQKRLSERREQDYGIFRRKMLETFRKGLSEAKFKKVEDAVRIEVIEKYVEGNPMFEKLLEIAINNRLAKLAAIPSIETWSKSENDVGVPT